MSQLNNKSFEVVNKMIKAGYKVVGKWSNGVVMQNDGNIQIVPYEINSKIAVVAKTDFIKDAKEKSNKQELLNLYKNGLASEEQVRAGARREQTREM